jgi:cbb3-type cytochrome oxidase subunit 3
MSTTLFSLIAVTVGFAALIAWVYWPSRKSRLEALGRIPLDSDSDVKKGEEK